ncbi:MAG: helix-turn-helix domain-containing protein [Halioglobus sp.]|nr:helix-turn-helix domain-containing protein [Halioglobus sp.]
MLSQTNHDKLPQPTAPLLSTRRLDELEAFHCRETEPRAWSYIRPRKSALFRISRLKLHSSEIYNCSFSSAIRGISEPLKSFQLMLPIQGHIVNRSANRNLAVHPGFVSIQFPGSCADNCWQDNTRALVIRVGTASLEPFLSRRRLESPPSGRLLLSTTSGLGQSFQELLRQLYNCCESVPQSTEKGVPSAHNAIENLMLYCLALTIENQPVADAIPRMRDDTRKMPSSLRTTLEYIHANLDKPIVMSELAAVSGVSCRALQKSFAKHTGSGPLAFIRAARLDRVREQLLNVSPDNTTVTDTAMRWGFYHLGDFARYYLQKFGEHPSQTLHR